MKKIAVIGFLSFSLVSPALSVEVPASQYSLATVVARAAVMYERETDSSNALRLNVLRSDRQSELCAALPSNQFLGWRAVVKEIGTVGAHAVLRVSVSNDVDLVTLQHGDGGDLIGISPTSPLYRTLLNLSVGDAVFISGELQYGESDCYATRNSDDIGAAMTSPVFMFSATDIELTRQLDWNSASREGVGSAGSVCNLTIQRVNIGNGRSERIGVGSARFGTSNAIELEGDWLTVSPSATDTSFSEEIVVDGGDVSGFFTVNYLFSDQRDNPPKVINMSMAKPVLGELMPTGFIHFPIDSTFDGIIEFSDCSL